MTVDPLLLLQAINRLLASSDGWVHTAATPEAYKGRDKLIQLVCETLVKSQTKDGTNAI